MILQNFDKKKKTFQWLSDSNETLKKNLLVNTYMLTIQQQYYEYMQRQRMRAMYQYAVIQTRIANLKFAQKVGIDIRKDPRYVDEYLALVDQFGSYLFVFEDDKKSVLKKEESKENG